MVLSLKLLGLLFRWFRRLQLLSLLLLSELLTCSFCLLGLELFRGRFRGRRRRGLARRKPRI